MLRIGGTVAEEKPVAETKTKPKAAKAGAIRRGKRVSVKLAKLKARMSRKKSKGIEFGGGTARNAPKIKVPGLRTSLVFPRRSLLA